MQVRSAGGSEPGVAGVTLHLEPSDDFADYVAVPVQCPVCGHRMKPLGTSNTSGITAWLPVKCTHVGCRREWAVKAQMVPVSEQIAQAHYS